MLVNPQILSTARRDSQSDDDGRPTNASYPLLLCFHVSSDLKRCAQPSPLLILVILTKPINTNYTGQRSITCTTSNSVLVRILSSKFWILKYFTHFSKILNARFSQYLDTRVSLRSRRIHERQNFISYTKL